MLFSKNAFFFLLFLILIGPFVLPNIIWLLRSTKTTGVVEGIGTPSGITLGRSTYAYTSFRVGRDTFYFQGKDDDYKRGDVIPVLYQAKNPEDARVSSFFSVWGNTIAYCGVPLMLWIICFFGKDIVPKGHGCTSWQETFFKSGEVGEEINEETEMKNKCLQFKTSLSNSVLLLVWMQKHCLLLYQLPICYSFFANNYLVQINALCKLLSNNFIGSGLQLPPKDCAAISSVTYRQPFSSLLFIPNNPASSMAKIPNG